MLSTVAQISCVTEQADPLLFVRFLTTCSIMFRVVFGSTSTPSHFRTKTTGFVPTRPNKSRELRYTSVYSGPCNSIMKLLCSKIEFSATIVILQVELTLRVWFSNLINEHTNTISVLIWA